MPELKLVLIDGDLICYRCAFAAERTKYLVLNGEWHRECESKKEADEFIGTIWSRKELQPVENALNAAKTTIETIRRDYPAGEYRIYLSDSLCHRDALARTKKYKGNRTQPKPTHYEAVKDYLLREHRATIGIRQEADDAIGIAATAAYPDVAIFSSDKDLRQIAGWHGPLFDRGTSGGLEWVTRRQGDFQLYSQILSGDATDNIPGLEGVGSKRAASALEGAKSTCELYTRCWALYRDRGLAFSYFKEQCDLVYILRHDDEAGFSAPCPVVL